MEGVGLARRMDGRMVGLDGSAREASLGFGSNPGCTAPSGWISRQRCLKSATSAASDLTTSMTLQNCMFCFESAFFAANMYCPMRKCIDVMEPASLCNLFFAADYVY